MSVTYGNFAGEVIYESRNSVERWYVPDALGSTAALVDMDGMITDTYDYWSYGEERTHFGTNQTPLTFVGTLGYVSDVINGLLYVRARHLRPDLGRWQTVDPLWPRQIAYEYVSGRPIIDVDPSGLYVIPVLCTAACALVAACALGVWIACKDWEGAWPSFITQCAADYIDSLPWWSKGGCLVGLGGCLACIGAFIAGRLRPPVPVPPPIPIPLPLRCPDPLCVSKCLAEMRQTCVESYPYDPIRQINCIAYSASTCAFLCSKTL